ncbi:glycosyltransferase family 4 protein [Robiginitalea aurantiaca]|nr:glycosyltransferase family 4 protein [Robiginitalea aurantiaca]
MKILFCTNKFSEVSNGPAKFANLVLDINEQFREHEIRILTEDVSESGPCVYKLDLKYPKALGFFGQLFRIIQYHRAAQKIKTNYYSYDILVYNNALIGLYSTILKPETIGMVNDYNNACRDISNFKFKYKYLKNLIFKQLEWITLKNQKTTIVNSRFLANYLASKYKIPRSQFQILYKGIEIPKQTNSTEIDCSKIIKVLFVKANYYLGGLPLLLSALGMLPFGFELTIIGPKNIEENQIKQMLAGKNNVSIVFLGYQSQKVVFKKLLETHIYSVPSYREALGVANLEAISYGVPVITTNVGGIPEVLKYGDCGWLVEPGNVKQLSEAFRECITNNDLRNKKIEMGLKHCMSFDYKIILENFIEILNLSKTPIVIDKC